MTTAVGLRLGDDQAWVELAPDPEDPEQWRVTADWVGAFTADFETYLETQEAAAFTDALLAGVDGGGSFRLDVTKGRNNPLLLQSVPAGDRLAFVVRLTPNGHDAVVHLDLEIDPMDRAELRGRIEEFRRSLV
ncbi:MULTISPECIES: hypothetical protein [unclassified Streptomyces]|uniref:hypothetical protein n=1 Tax=unclassified Streptomyces TaxID=2593676 RepID=UPI002966BD3A|nr:hypothetical protein [Streptomyces sp. SJL17-1]